MKTRSAAIEPPNIAAGVKARRMARVSSPLYRSPDSQILPTPSANEIGEAKVLPTLTTPGHILVSSINMDKPETSEQSAKGRQTSGPKFLKDSWTADDRRLFFQGIRLYGRNFTELTRFIRSRGHRGTSGCDTLPTPNCAQQGVADPVPTPVGGAHNAQNMTSAPPSTAGCSLPPTGGQPSSQPSSLPGAPAFPLQDLNAAAGGRTRDQVRLFYQQTWHKLRRYIKYPDGVPQHVREVYALVNWSIMRSRIKKALDNRLGEKLNELVHYGSTCVKHNGRRFLLRTPVCPALKQINKISAPAQEFTLPEDVWVELVPSSQIVAWRVLEAEQNPRLRLRVDINRQLSDVISLVEAKWMYPVERIRSLLELNCEQQPSDGSRGDCGGRLKVDDFAKDHLLLRFPKEQKLEGAISLQEVSRTRSADISLSAYQARRLEALSTVGQREESEESSRPSPAVPKVAALSSGPPEVSVDVDNVKETMHTEAAAVFHEMEDCSADQTSVRPQESSARPPPTSVLPPTSAVCPNYTLPPVNPVVHLDLRSAASCLMSGVTFEEARSLKLLVIYLALGCPARIRFEYDFVHLSTANGKTLIKNTRQGNIITDGISNGLRRLLHLNASDYLNYKDWTRNHNQTSARPTASTKNRLASNATTLNEGTPPGERPQAPQSSFNACQQPEVQIHPPLVSSGHEAVVVGQTTKVVVARQLNVCGPEAGPAQVTAHPTPTCVADVSGSASVSASPQQSAVSVTTPVTLPSQIRPSPRVLLPRPHPPFSSGQATLAPATQRPPIPAPQSSLSALRAFNQSQARSSRTARSRSLLSSQTVRRGRNPPPVAAPTPHTTAAMPVTTTTIWTPGAMCESGNQDNSPSRRENEGIHTTLTASTTTAAPAPAATSGAIAPPALGPFSTAASAPSVRVNYSLDTSAALYTAEVGTNSTVSITPSTATATPSDAMRLNQNTFDSLPQPDFGPSLSLDGYTNQSSTSDTMKSLLNAIMRTVPPSSAPEETENQHHSEQQSHQEQDQGEQEQHQDFNSLCQLDLMYPSPAAGNSTIPFPIVLGTPENTQPPPPPDFQFPGPSPVSYSLLLNEDSSSSLGAVITGLSRRSGAEPLQPAGGESSLSDSLACKILMEMAHPTVDDIPFTIDVKPATTDGAILTDQSETLAPGSGGGPHPDWFPNSSDKKKFCCQDGFIVTQDLAAEDRKFHLLTPVESLPAQSPRSLTEVPNAVQSTPLSLPVSSDQVPWDTPSLHASTSEAHIQS
ncbi:hypothetical protein AAHC03_04874 [Spirometra sp. Aus1]